ncbi:MAG: hypothetical protein D6734_08375 [Candidatus Schekmanbacteria bacterium]|nr:MAG: hypothetical protein D6734_08375 [Candidatus Schekmanbacteria bacterium]
MYEIGLKAYNIFDKAQLFDMYHSWWFIALITLFAINLFLCSIKRIPNALKFYTHPSFDHSNGKMLKKIDCLNSSVETSVEKLNKILSQKFGSPLIKNENGEKCYLFQKGRIGRLGVYITHTSIFIIFIGAIIGSIAGFKGYVSLLEGEKSSTYWDANKKREIPLGFDIKCEKAYVEYYTDIRSRMPKDWRSELSIIKDGKVVKKKTIEVNDPLEYNGIVFYQSSFGEGGVKKLILTIQPRDGRKPFVVELDSQEEVKIDDETKIRLLRFVPDFVISDGEIFSKSEELVNPAAQIEIIKGNERKSQWIFQKYPDFHSTGKGEYNIIFSSVVPKNRTGLQVAKDPGVNVVWLGCVVMLLGLYISFFVPHKRIWVKCTDSSILVTGTTSKNKPSFENEAGLLMDEIERSLKC